MHGFHRDSFFFFGSAKGCLLIFHADAPPEEGGKGINWPIRLEMGWDAAYISALSIPQTHPRKKPGGQAARSSVSWGCGDRAHKVLSGAMADLVYLILT